MGEGADLQTSYLICTTPRTGSWLLCDALAQTGLAGVPQEYLTDHIPFDLGWGTPSRETFDAYMAWVCQQATTPNGVRGLKVHWSQMLHLMDELRVSGPALIERLREFLPGLVFIRLRRYDTVRQALSWHRAMTEGRWWHLSHTPPGPDSFTPDLTAVAELVTRIRAHDRQWDELMAQIQVEPVALSYEAVIADPVQATLICLRALGVPTAAARRAVRDLSPRIRKQSDDGVTAVWVDQFEHQFGEMAVHVKETV